MSDPSETNPPLPPTDPHAPVPPSSPDQTVPPEYQPVPQQHTGFPPEQPPVTSFPPEQPPLPAVEPVAPEQPNFDTVNLQPQPQPPQQVPGFETMQLQETPPVPQGQESPPLPPVGLESAPTMPGQAPPPPAPAPTPAAPAVGAAAGAPRLNTKGGASRRPATATRKGASSRRPSAAGSRYPTKSKPADTLSPGTVILALLGACLLAVAIMALMPKSLIHIDGYPADEMAANKEPKNLLKVGQGLLLGERKEDATFTEKEVNAYLNYRLNTTQTGLLGGFMRVKGVYVDLSENQAEIFIERSLPIFGSTTISNKIVSHFNDVSRKQEWKAGGGSIGRIPMKNKSLQPIFKAFMRMGAVGRDEIDLMNYMADIKIGEDKVTLDSSLR